MKNKKLKARLVGVLRFLLVGVVYYFVRHVWHLF
jgi:hypothetical protein